MASLKKHGNKYYARIRWRNANQVAKEKTIPLATHLKSEALVRKTAKALKDLQKKHKDEIIGDLDNS